MVKASIPSVAGLSNFGLNLGICLEQNDANLSTVCGPHKISKAAKILVFNILSSWSMSFESWSDNQLASPGIHSGINIILLSLHTLYILIANWCRCCFLLPITKIRSVF